MIEVLKYNHILLSWLGLYTDRSIRPSTELFLSFIRYLIISHIAAACISSAMFVSQETSHFNFKLEACIIVIGATQCGGAFINIAYKIKTVKALHRTLQQIIDKEKECNIINIYWNAEQKCRNCVKILLIFVVCHQGTFLVAILYSFYCIADGNFDTKTYFIPLHIAFPFNTQTLWKWYLLWFCELNMGFAYALSLVAITSYFVGCCFYLGAVCEHLNVIISSIGNYFTENLMENPKSSNHFQQQTNSRSAKQLLNKAVEMHVQILEVFHVVSDINSGAIFALFPPNAVYTGIAMYNLEHSINSAPHVIGYGIICIVCGLMWPFLFCHFATFVTNQIATVATLTYNTNWYNYPPEFQKSIILIIARSQDPAYFMGFNLIRCTLEAFSKLLQSSCSYYIIFRSLAKR